MTEAILGPLNPTLLLIGMLIGLVMSAPVGPVNVLCSIRAFRGGFTRGFLVGVGAVSADMVIAGAAIFGIAAVGEFIDRHAEMIKTVGGIVLLLFAWRTWWSPPVVPDLENPEGETRPSRGGGYLGGIALTVTNPAAYLAYAAVFSGLGAMAPRPANLVDGTELLLGLAIGGLLWWAMIAWVVARYRHALPFKWLVRINHGAAAIMAAFGALLVIRSVWIAFVGPLPFGPILPF